MRHPIIWLVLSLFLVASVAFAEEGDKKEVEKKDFKASFAPDMQLFFRYEMNLKSDFDADVHKSQLFNTDRSYLGFTAQPAENVFFRITADAYYEGGPEKMLIKLKYAYVELDKLVPMSKLVLGVQKTAIADYETGGWGHRDLARTAVDGWSLDPTADAGIGIVGKTPCGMLSWNLALLAGEDYNIDEKVAIGGDSTKAKALSLFLAITPLASDETLKGLSLGLSLKRWFDSTTGANDHSDLVGAAVTFKHPLLTIMAEYFLRSNFNHPDFAGGLQNNALLSFGATVNVIPKTLAAVVRYDIFDPGTAIVDNEYNSLLLGLKYFFAEKTSLSLLFSSTTAVATAPTPSSKENTVSFVLGQSF